ncbi:MAG: helix-turn-helix domain-containing protein [Zoogloeaceae bacterium]|jgi:AraC family transcriptional regulator of adaptative response / DNA-3-methyladenine glycosylase II|nr:helix-turn-helix domain-containing protein [Zoogloeaceae bacterium]
MMVWRVAAVLANRDALYAAFVAKDARFDGRFFVGVASTGIYCRPVCKARQPKFASCTFYETAAEAEQCGYRPCLLCRPEIAPGRSMADASANLALRAARMLEDRCASGERIDEIAGRLGCTDRHLRRVFMDEYHVLPVQFLQTCRLLLAKSLLTDTDLSILEVAMAAGFGSLRRFNDLFRERYKCTPTDLCRRAPGEKRRDSITLALGYRPPYGWAAMLGFFAGRAIAGVETVTDGAYFRTVRLARTDKKRVDGWLGVKNNPDKNMLSVTVSESLLPVLPQVLARIKRQFDVHCDPNAVHETLSSMNDIRPDLCVIGTRLPGCFNPFEMSVRAVLGQQITVKAAGTLAARIAKTFGMPIQTGIHGLAHIFPSPEDVMALGETMENRFGKLGITSARVKTIRELARGFTQNEIDFDYCARPEEEIQKLLKIRGIGNWTANYIAMRAMGFTDAFLETDYGVKKALPSHAPKELLRLAENWRPWRGYAIINLWNTL